MSKFFLFLPELSCFFHTGLIHTLVAVSPRQAMTVGVHSKIFKCSLMRCSWRCFSRGICFLNSLKCFSVRVWKGLCRAWSSSKKQIWDCPLAVNQGHFKCVSTLLIMRAKLCICPLKRVQSALCSWHSLLSLVFPAVQESAWPKPLSMLLFFSYAKRLCKLICQIMNLCPSL